MLPQPRQASLRHMPDQCSPREPRNNALKGNPRSDRNEIRMQMKQGKKERKKEEEGRKRKKDECDK